jgi:hypothetical protein
MNSSNFLSSAEKYQKKKSPVVSALALGHVYVSVVVGVVTGGLGVLTGS